MSAKPLAGRLINAPLVPLVWATKGFSVNAEATCFPWNQENGAEAAPQASLSGNRGRLCGRPAPRGAGIREPLFPGQREAVGCGRPRPPWGPNTSVPSEAGLPMIASRTVRCGFLSRQPALVMPKHAALNTKRFLCSQCVCV